MHEFAKIPGSAIVYWASAQVRSIFQEKNGLRDVAQFKAGMSTGNNPMFQRNWFEIEGRRFAHPSSSTSERSDRRWFPCNSGGDFRKWYGNDESVVDWENGGARIKAYHGSAVRNEGYYFREGLTYNKISIGRFAARYRGTGYVFDDTGRCVFPNGEATNVYTTLAFLCSAVADHFLKMLTPTVSFTSKELEAVPWRNRGGDNASDFSKECILLARADWDNFETSWDFRDLPLLRPGLKGETLEASWRNWEAQNTAAVRRMQDLETENNRLFIAAYGLEGELEPAVPAEQITLARAEARRDMAAFLSYAVGCMMGRYSLDAEGLILADAGDTADDYLRVVNEKWGELDEGSGITEDELIFPPDEDGIIPMLDGEWFEDDIVARTKEFLRDTFDDATLAENLRFIEQSLGRELRDYFLTDFYKDHLQTYKNRPIYWLFSSGKQRTFQCLVYLHRYTPATLARIRTEYVIPLQGKLAARINRLDEEIGKTTASTTRKKLQTDLDKFKKQIVELLAFDEQLRSYADQAIAVDLDDGVKTNYAKFGPLVAESKKVCGTTED
jgi:type II restriction/modification system DNA methylase subunit YeeA